MSASPIAEQSGLSPADLKNMEPVEQKYKSSSDYSPNTLSNQLGLSTQKLNLKNLIIKAMVNWDKAKQEVDAKDEYALDKCLDDFVEELSNGISDMIKAQSWVLETKDKTDVSFTNSGWEGVTEGEGKGVATNLQVTNE